jgi:uncharacterized protein
MTRPWPTVTKGAQIRRTTPPGLSKYLRWEHRMSGNHDDEVNDRAPYDEVVVIDPGALSADALKGIAEAFVLREGTDYGELELSFDTKVGNLLKLVASREARIVFDPQTESVSIIRQDG